MKTTIRTTIRTTAAAAGLAAVLATTGCSVGDIQEVDPSADQSASDESAGAADDAAGDAAAGDDAADDAAGDQAALVTVEADGLSVDVLDGMQPYDAPEGYSGFWQTAEGTSPQVTVGVAGDVDPASFLTDQLNNMSGSMDDLEVTDQSDTQVTFTGTGVDGETYTGIAAVNDTVGVLATSGPGADADTLQQIADSAS